MTCNVRLFESTVLVTVAPNKVSYAQNFDTRSIQFKFQKLLIERCFIVNLDVLKSGDSLEFTE